MGKEAHDKDWRDDPLENMTPVRGSSNFLKDRGYSGSTWKMRSHNIVQIQTSVGLGSVKRAAEAGCSARATCLTSNRIPGEGVSLLSCEGEESNEFMSWPACQVDRRATMRSGSPGSILPAVKNRGQKVLKTAQLQQAMSGDYLGGRAARRFAGTTLRCLVTGFGVSTASNN
jgi:hypothetical protein